MSTRPALPLLAVSAVVLITACGSSESPDSAETSPAPADTASASPEEQPEADDEGSEDQEPDDDEDQSPAQDEEDAGLDEEEEQHAEALAERDQFLEDQQLPVGEPELEATTPEQKDYIESLSQNVESQGGAWNAELETVALALTLDACESAILNFHDVDEDQVSMHIQTSPLFSSLVPPDEPEESREALEADYAGTMVYGMGYICPEDQEQWESIVGDLYPEHLDG